MTVLSMPWLLSLARISLAFLWLFTGLTSVFFSPELGYGILANAGINGAMADACVYGGAWLDMGLGIWLLTAWRLNACCIVQVITIVIYTLLLSIIEPSFWLHPFGPLTKNMPILVLILLLQVNSAKTALNLK